MDSTFIEVIGYFGEIKHWAMCPASDQFGNVNLSCPPIFRWTYANPSSETAEWFQRIVADYRGKVAWDFVIDGQVWCLMPSRINEYSKLHGNRGALGVAFEFTTLDPEFGKRANADFPLLIEHIRTNLGAITAGSM